MHHIVDLTAHDNIMFFPQCGVDENMISTMIFEDSQVMIGDEVETLVCHSLSLLLALFICIARDRKSTRLNSSHANISYAVFCLKKKKNFILINGDSTRDQVDLL